jgi:hypothetical protein
MISKDQAFCLALLNFVLLALLSDGRRPRLQLPQAYPFLRSNARKPMTASVCQRMLWTP